MTRWTLASMRPGTTYCPATSTIRSSRERSSSEADPTHEIRPSSTTTAAFARGGDPVPSIRVAPTRAVEGGCVSGPASLPCPLLPRPLCHHRGPEPLERHSDTAERLRHIPRAGIGRDGDEPGLRGDPFP